MHLVPTERRNRRILEDHRVCEAIAAIGDRTELAAWAERFALLSEPKRLALLLAIAHAGPISVSDLAVAVDMNDTAVSQTLRLLRASGIVTASRDGRIVRYELTNREIRTLLKHMTGEPVRRRRVSS